MKYKNEKEMLFYFLNRFDYSKPLEDLLHDVLCDFGDFYFTKITWKEMHTLVSFMWTQLNDKNLD